jgi:hypothetical protein
MTVFPAGGIQMVQEFLRRNVGSRDFALRFSKT